MVLTMLAIGSWAPATWCAVTPTVHFSAAVVFFQSASLSFSSTAVASCTLASYCLANASAFAPMVSSSVDGCGGKRRCVGPSAHSMVTEAPGIPPCWSYVSHHLLIERGGSKSTPGSPSPCPLPLRGRGIKNQFPLPSREGEGRRSS